MVQVRAYAAPGIMEGGNNVAVFVDIGVGTAEVSGAGYAARETVNTAVVTLAAAVPSVSVVAVGVVVRTARRVRQHAKIVVE
jgi:hypothetical protein